MAVVEVEGEYDTVELVDTWNWFETEEFDGLFEDSALIAVVKVEAQFDTVDLVETWI